MKNKRKALFSLLLAALMLIGATPLAGGATVSAAAYNSADGATYKYVLVNTLTPGNTYLIANAASGTATLAGVADGTAEGGAIGYTSVSSSSGTISPFSGVENYEWNLMPSRSAGVNTTYSTPATYMLQNMATGSYLYNPVYDSGNGSDMRVTYDPMNDTYPQSTRQVFNSETAFNTYVTKNGTGSAVQEESWVKIGRSGASDPNVYFNFRTKDSASANGVTGFYKGGFIDYNVGGVTKMGFFEFIGDTIEGRESINLTGGTGAGGSAAYRQAANSWAGQELPAFLVNWGGSTLTSATSTTFSGKTLKQIRFDIDCDQFLYISSVYLAKSDHARVALHFYRLNESVYGTNGYYPSHRFPFCQFAISTGSDARTIGNFDTTSSYYAEQYYYGWSGSEFIRSWKGSSSGNTYFYEKQIVTEPAFVWTLVTSASEIENGGVYMIASTDSDSTNATIMRITSGGLAASTGKKVSGGNLTDADGSATPGGNFYMRLYKVGTTGEFFVFGTQQGKYLRTNLSYDGFNSWSQLTEGGAFGGYYGAGLRCSYSFTNHRLEVTTNPQNSGESASSTILGLSDGSADPATHGTSYLYKKSYNIHTHSYSSTVATPATCASTGVRIYTCATCNHTYSEEIPKDPANHTDLRAVAAVPATCTASGNTAYRYCSGCGNYYNSAGSAQITEASIAVAPLGHSYGDWIVDTPATETAAGRKHKTCVRCGDTQYATIPATGAVATTVGSISATSGSTVSLDVVLSCNPGIFAQNFVIYYPRALTLNSVTPVGDVYPVSEPVFSDGFNTNPALNIKMNELFTEAGISTSGVYGVAYYADNGSVSNTYSNGTILRMSFTLPTKAAGCLESYTVGIFGTYASLGDDAFDRDGESVGMAYVPGVISVTDVGVCASHTWGALITDTAATCTAAGSGHKVCTVCGEVMNVAIPAAGHTSGAWTVTTPATCTSQGQKIQTCTVCGATINTQTIPATGHSPDAMTVTTPATCTSQGQTVQFCTVCGEVINIQIIPATGHTPGAWTVTTPATCTTAGQKKQTCTVCGAPVMVQTVPATGHTFSAEWTVDVEPTETTPGQKSRHCIYCDAVTDVTAIDPVSPVLPGDVNGDGKITSKDLAAVKKYISGVYSESNINFANSDINGDGKVNTRDLGLIKRIIVDG